MLPNLSGSGMTQEVLASTWPETHFATEEFQDNYITLSHSPQFLLLLFTPLNTRRAIYKFSLNRPDYLPLHMWLLRSSQENIPFFSSTRCCKASFSAPLSVHCCRCPSYNVSILSDVNYSCSDWWKCLDYANMLGLSSERKLHSLGVVSRKYDRVLWYLPLWDWRG
jgi:hypothetical protein